MSLSGKDKYFHYNVHNQRHNPINIERELSRAIRSLDRNPQKSIKHADKILRFSKRNCKALRIKCHALLQAQKIDEALQVVGELLDIDRTSFSNVRLAAKIYTAAGRHSDAFKVTRLCGVAQLHPHKAYAIAVSMAEALRKKQWYRTALRCLDAAEERWHHTDQYGELCKAYCHMHLEEFVSSLHSFSRARGIMAMHPDSTDLRMRLACGVLFLYERSMALHNVPDGIMPLLTASVHFLLDCPAPVWHGEYVSRLNTYEQAWEVIEKYHLTVLKG